MLMTIYDKPVKVLMCEYAAEVLTKGMIFEKRDAAAWFKQHYPEIKSNTVEMHVEGMAVNSTARKHHPNIKPGSGHDLFFKVAPGRFRLWESETDPEPVYREQLIRQLEENRGNTEEDEDTEQEVSTRVFAFERDLRNYLAKNLGLLEDGIKLYEDEEFTGIEFPVGGRFIDILTVDQFGDFVVIELKVSRGYDRAVGQLLRYMGWVRKNLATGKKVRGVIVASEITKDLKLAVSLVPEVQLFEYEISFSLRPVPC
jgi:RecB family endonuclease NucS